ncbi:MAG: orotidine 5'-phosphate decarboxylase, partial [Armatimonadetes bacterium]|nr:orotidine 5'-phosphate decarboxylase [Armatimonadota bacterium]
MLQIAMDYITLPPALAMAVKVAPEVDIIEIGTPLCKAVGLDAIRAMREMVGPDKLILADFKSPDVGGLEAKMAFDAGADMMTVIGGAALATVESALDAAKAANKEMLMELTGVRDIVARAQEWRQIGVERMVYHRGWDEQAFARQWVDQDRTVIRQLIDMGFKITVTGGLNKQLLSFFQPLAVSVVICGRGIRETPDPRQSAREFRMEMQRLWGAGGIGGATPPYPGGKVATNTAAENAAKALRWGVSEMGLMLTVDGHDCPGCDSPQRFCWGTRVEVVAPAGVNAGDVVAKISQNYGRTAAVTRGSENSLVLDPAQLPNSTPNQVLDLLRAMGNALRGLGCAVDTAAGVA